jgi:hypothetical protein
MDPLQGMDLYETFMDFNNNTLPIVLPKSITFAKEETPQKPNQNAERSQGSGKDYSIDSVRLLEYNLSKVRFRDSCINSF